MDYAEPLVELKRQALLAEQFACNGDIKGAIGAALAAEGAARNAVTALRASTMPPSPRHLAAVAESRRLVAVADASFDAWHAGRR